MLEWLTEPWQFGFMRQALLMVVLIAVVAGVLSPYLVLKGWSLMGDAVSHAVLPGVVLAYVAGVPLSIGAFCAGLLCALASGFVSDNSRLKSDTVLGVVFSGMFGLGIVLFSQIESEIHLDHVLLGDILGVDSDDIIEAAVAVALVLGIFLFFWRDLMLFAFDADHARVVGLPVQWLHYGLLVVLSLTVVLALQAVGLILGLSLLIAPGAIAHQFCDRFAAMLATSVTVAVGSSVGGVWLSFYLDSAPGPTIVVILTGIFLVAFVAAPKYGLLWQRGQRA
ncbi:MAG: metal ABC transporter permease [Granulosicoccaceae bacterium]